MTYQKTIGVPRLELSCIEAYLDGTSGDMLNEGETIAYTAEFPDGMEMDVKCCGCKDAPAFSEAVLFAPGQTNRNALFEVGYTDPEDSFEGDWELEYDGDTYVATIVAA